MIFFKGPKAVLRTRANRDVANPDFSEIPQTEIRDFPLERTLDDLLLTRNQSQVGHVQEEAMFHYPYDGVDLGRDLFRVFNEKAGAVENEISFVCEVPCSVPIHSKSW